MIEHTLPDTGECVLIHDEMPISDIEYLLKNWHVTAKGRRGDSPEEKSRNRKAWDALTRILQARGYRSILSYRQLELHHQRPTARLTLEQFKSEVNNIRDSQDSKKYSHPVEWFLRTWRGGPRQMVSLSNPRRVLTLVELVEFLRTTSPTQLKSQNRERWNKLSEWVGDNFGLTLDDFYRYFLVHRVPAFAALLRDLTDGNNQQGISGHPSGVRRP